MKKATRPTLDGSRSRNRAHSPGAQIAMLQLAIAFTFVQTLCVAQTVSDAPPVRPVAVWPASPIEVIATFARPLDPAIASNWIGRTISVQKSSQQPQTITGAAATPLATLGIANVRLVDHGRTAILATDPHCLTAQYVLPLPAAAQPNSPKTPKPPIIYDLCGVELTWTDENGAGDEPRWTGWWPELDSAASDRLLSGTEPRDQSAQLVTNPGRLTLSTLATLTRGEISLGIESNQPIEEFLFGDQQADPVETKGADGWYHAVLTTNSTAQPTFLNVTLRTTANSPPFALRSWARTAASPTKQPIERAQLLLPWAPSATAPATSAAGADVTIPNLTGGNPQNGRVLFSGETGRCAQCHLFRGQGGRIGPDLTEIGRKPVAEIYRSIAAPSAEIDPHYTTYTVATKDGQVLSGVVRSSGPDDIVVLDTNSRSTTLSRGRIRQIRPSGTSVMPVGLAASLGDSGVRDVLAFLTTPP